MCLKALETSKAARIGENKIQGEGERMFMKISHLFCELLFP